MFKYNYKIANWPSTKLAHKSLKNCYERLIAIFIVLCCCMLALCHISRLVLLLNAFVLTFASEILTNNNISISVSYLGI